MALIDFSMRTPQVEQSGFDAEEGFKSGVGEMRGLMTWRGERHRFRETQVPAEINHKPVPFVKPRRRASRSSRSSGTKACLGPRTSTGARGLGDVMGVSARTASGSCTSRADRLARDLMVGEVILGEFHALGVSVVAAESGTDLTVGDDDPTRVLIRQVLGAVSQFEKA